MYMYVDVQIYVQGILCILYVVVCIEMRRKGVSGLVNSTQHAPPSCVSVGTNTDISGDLPPVGEGITELNIEGALTDELKLLQVCVCEGVCV